MGTDDYKIQLLRNGNTVEPTRKGLLIDVGMEQNSRAQQGAVGRHNVEGVGVMLPARIPMGNRRRNPPTVSLARIGSALG